VPTTDNLWWSSRSMATSSTTPSPPELTMTPPSPHAHSLVPYSRSNPSSFTLTWPMKETILILGAFILSEPIWWWEIMLSLNFKSKWECSQGSLSKQEAPFPPGNEATTLGSFMLAPLTLPIHHLMKIMMMRIWVIEEVGIQEMTLLI